MEEAKIKGAEGIGRNERAGEGEMGTGEGIRQRTVIGR